MCEAGRILHHLKNNIENKNNIVLIVGYSANHTLGRRIVEKDPYIKIFGEKYELNAEVIVMNSFSAHADADELINYCNKFDKGRMQNIFLTHGDYDQQEKFKTRLTSNGFQTITIPVRGDVFPI
jgi:metallo-beta-lactamase family protein